MSTFGMKELGAEEVTLGDEEVTLAPRVPGVIAAGLGLCRQPLRIRRHRPSCHLCKLLQQRAEVKCSTCVASINRISRSLVEFLLKSLVAGLIFLTPQMPCSWQPWLCHAPGGEQACAGRWGSPRAVPGGVSASLGMGAQGHHAPNASSLWGKWERLRSSLEEESLEGHQAPAKQLVGRSVHEQPPCPTPLCFRSSLDHLGALPGGSLLLCLVPSQTLVC